MVAATGLILVVSGCSGRDGHDPTAPAGASTRRDPAPSSGPGPAGTSGQGGSTGSTGSKEAKAKSPPFAADTDPDVSTKREGYPVLVSVTQGDHGS